MILDPQLQLKNIRNVLIRQEETIIFSLIERAQYKVNPIVYTNGGIQISGFDGSYMDFFLFESECAQSKIRRYTTPEEHPFFTNLPEPVIEGVVNEVPIIENKINVNDRVKETYINKLVPMICEEGEDKQYGSSVLCDISCLQAISKRVHYGEFVAESKFRDQPEKYTGLIKAKDREAIWDLLTNQEVEDKLLRRVQLKAASYGQDPELMTGDYKVHPDHIVELYRDWIIPLTKEVQVEYLMVRV